ncbi:hypothetical protein EDD33_3808 [Nocardioides aurantiacus]|uniref:Glycoprotein n=1 Tax=Nocardioides aurantiacus TaxID=86796 RepID=A0A3N2CZE4_9ACTN|nr:hypothetical protein EDD33_3808 [Nocardioides aurantiacus]
MLAVVALLVAPLVGVALGGATDPAVAVEEPAATPLTVRLDSMSPAVLPRRGSITLEGSVSNDSEEDWDDVNVTPFSSTTPLTTREDLALAAQTPEQTTVGERLDVFDAVGDLGPGESADFAVRVPVGELPISGDPGAYWIGVHALGTDAAGRDAVADGRARTFVPLLTPRQARSASVPVSLVLPLRQAARRAADGSLDDPQQWVDLSAEEGRLTRLADLAATAGDRPLTWLADPAVLDALSDLGRGNPPVSLETRSEGSDEGSEEDDPEESPAPSGGSDAAGVPDGAAAERARALVQRLRDELDSRDLLTLPYADPDAAALARRRPPLLARAATLSERRTAARDLVGRAVVAPPGGFFDPELVEALPEDEDLLLSDQGELALSPASTLDGRRLTLADARTSAGGPAPVSGTDPLALRQRVLAEAATQVVAGDEVRPIVVTLPQRWDPGAAWREADLFDGLDTGWVRFAALPSGGTAYDGQLPYPRSQRAAEIGTDNLRAAVELAAAGRTLSDLLTGEDDVSDDLLGASLQAVSYSARRLPRLNVERTDALAAAARGELARVRVTGNDLVSLSSGSGDVTVTVVNDLEQPVTVGLRVETDAEVEIDTGEAVQLGPGQRSTARLPVRSSDGVHEVTMQPVTSDGAAVGEPFTFSLRTSEVGRVIWVVIAAGGVLLAVMIARRVVLRLRSRHRRERPTDPAKDVP